MTVGQSQFIAPFSAHTCHGRQFEGLTPKPQTQICHSIHHDEGRRRGTPSSSVWSVVASMFDSWMLSPPVLFAVLLLREGGGRLGESGCVDACVGVGVEGRGGGRSASGLRRQVSLSFLFFLTSGSGIIFTIVGYLQDAMLLSFGDSFVY